MFLFQTQAAGGWDSFKTGMESFFKDGLGSTGLQGNGYWSCWCIVQFCMA
jgi:hypothetical protein